MKLLSVLLLVGCQSVSGARQEVSALQTESDRLRTQNFDLQNTQRALEGVITNDEGRVNALLQNEQILQAEKAQRSVHYILHVSIRQVSYSLSLRKQLRDAVNEEEFDIPTDKTTYEHADVGSDLFESFRAGSAIFHGSLGSWRLKVVGKRVQIDG